MSLAMYAAPFEESLKDNNENDNIINRKRQHNKTQKSFVKENYDTEKVNNLLDKIHESTDTEGDGLGDFNPPPQPVSSGVTKTITTEQMHNMSNEIQRSLYPMFQQGMLHYISC